MRSIRTNKPDHRAGGRVTFRPRSSWPAGALAGAAPLLALLLAASPRPCAAADDQAESWAADTSVDSAAGVDYMWVLRNSLIHAEDVPRIVERAKRMGVRGLLVQVIGRGDAWYRSDRLPAPEPLQGSGRDPLGEILPLAHAAGLEVHAWVRATW